MTTDTLEPPDGEDEDPTKEDLIIPGVINYSKLRTPKLIGLREEIDEELETLEELLEDKTDRGRELHSRRAAISIILNQRRSRRSKRKKNNDG